MTNRNLASPILCALVLSFVANPPLLSKADPGVSNSRSSAPAAATSGATVAPAAKHSTTYTVAAGDSLTNIAQKFKTTRKKLERLNNLAASTVKPGQVLQVPSAKSGPADGSNHSTALAAKAKPHHAYAMAQPVQDFDIPASTFASCPVPIPSPDEDADSPAPVVAEKRAPIAKLVSPAELTAEAAPERVVPAAPTPQVTDTVVAPSGSTKHFTKTVPSYSASVTSSPSAFNPPAPRPAAASARF